MITPSDFIADETGRLTPATETVLTLDDALSCDDDPMNITSYLSAFNNKSLSANQRLTACEYISREDKMGLTL